MTRLALPHRLMSLFDRRSAARPTPAGRVAPARVFLRRFRVPIAALVVVIATVFAVMRLRAPETPLPPVVPYSTIATAEVAGSVRAVLLADGGSRMIVELATPVTIDGVAHSTLSALVPARALSLADFDRWTAKGVTVEMQSAKRTPEPGQVIGLLATLLLIGAVVYMMRMQRTGGRTSKFTVVQPSSALRLDDVGGVQEARADLQDVLAYLEDPGRFEKIGATCPKGVLLVGPPGTGKTLLARAVAGETGASMIVAAGSQFNEMFVGVGAARIRSLIEQAKAKAPCIIFIDEFDSLGGRRGRANRSGEEENTLNQLLVEMDGMEPNSGIVWMAATNRQDMLDPAVTRPGRFTRVVEVGLPTVQDREAILRIHAGKKPIAPDVDLAQLARLTVGYSGAELANLLNEAAIVALRSRVSVIGAAHIEEARDKILLGRVRQGVVVSEEERRLVALHEAGHAVVGLVACPEDKLHKVTIEPRGRSLGAAHYAPDSDRYLHSRRYLEGVIAKALGGRAAERVLLGPDEVTSGAGSDLVQATGIARRMVGEYGMSDSVGLISAHPSAHQGAPSGRLQAQIDDAAKELIARMDKRAEEIVVEHRVALEAIADALMVHEVLSADDVRLIAAEHGVPVDGIATVTALGELRLATESAA